MPRTHEEERKLIEEYRKAAEQIAYINKYPVTVNKYGGVQILEDGAFVECFIWVSNEEL